jgi:FkbM family methyltransferase
MKLLIEVGAFDGEDSLRKYNQEGYDVVYAFEPHRELYHALKERTKHLLNYHVINKAVCLVDGTQPFNICRQGGASSLLSFKNNEELEKHWTANRYDIQYSGFSYMVETCRLDTFIEENKLQNVPIEYLHIDAQGVDLDVLRSLGKYIKNVKNGVLETVYQKEKAIYVEQESNVLDKVTVFLRNNNFKILDIRSNDITQCECNVYFQSLN